METQAQKLAVEVKASDRAARQFAKTAFVLVVVAVIGILSFIAFQSSRSNKRLETLVNNHYATTQSRDTQFAQELAAIEKNHDETQAEFNQQTAYFTCIINLVTQGEYPTNLSNCPVPTNNTTTVDVYPTATQTSPSSNPGASPDTSSSASSPATSSQTSTPSPSSGNNPTSTTKTQPVQKTEDNLDKILKDIGL